ncbi:MAG: aldo/keto reductase [Spirochaetaceae bacterium]|jgi:predicted aldo/keto reductase-like oxidoreductase|nr:aldo/keto reductase [Spirochaetaceae bacterium]
MEKRRYRNTDEFVSLLGFGCMRLPTREGGTSRDIDKEKTREMIEYARAAGVNYFDTAYMYHEGASEPVIGEILSSFDRKSFNLATKMPLMMLQHEAQVETIFNDQLKKCRVDYFDFYLLHNMNRGLKTAAERFKVYEFLKKKQEEGVIRHLGFSFHDSPAVLKEITGQWDFDFTQIQCNYQDWEEQDAKGQVKILASKGLPIIVMEPVRGGSLATLSESAVEIFKKADPAASPASWALRYAASIPEVLTVLSGMSTLDQVKDNTAILSSFKPLSGAEREVISAALLAYRKSATVPCTACRYCMDCPSGVDIPRNLAIFNGWKITLDKNPATPRFFFDMQYGRMGPEEQSSNCVNCGKCAEKCPQHIDIPRWMGVINTYVREGRLPA